MQYGDSPQTRLGVHSPFIIMPLPHIDSLFHVVYPYLMLTITLANLSARQLKRAVAVQERIEALEQELTAILSQSQSPYPRAQSGGGRLSPAARARIAAAQRLRWAKHRGETPLPSSRRARASTTRRSLSPEARAKIANAQRLRWAKARSNA